jgi:hypothetical protein
VKIARAIKAAVDAEGIVFEGPPQDEALWRAMKRVQREHPDLMAQIRNWYLRQYPPVQEPMGVGSEMSLDDWYLMMWLSRHRHWSELVNDEGNKSSP